MARSAGALIIVLIIVVAALFALGRYGGAPQLPWLAELTGEAPAEAPAAPTAEPAKPADTVASTPAEPTPAVPAETAPAPAEPAPSATPPATQPSAPATTDTATAAGSPAATAPGEPTPATFDVARVEPSGNAVLAGRADPKAIIVLYANGQEIARTQANENGEWVVALEKPLAPGEYELMVVTASPDGSRQVESRERLAVSVPKTADEPPMVALIAPDAPTKVLQQPEAPSGQATAAGTPATTAAPAATGPDATTAPTTSTGPLAVATVAKDQGRLTVSGTAAPDATVRVYFDDALIGETKAGSDGAWTLSATHDAGPGDHRVRVDQVAPADGTVTARAEVPFEVLGAADIAAAEANQTPADATDASVASGATAPAPAAEPAPAGGTQTAAAPAAGTADAGKAAEAKRTSIRIRRGDDLWSIAERLYGSGERYTAIYRANRKQIRDPDLIYPGQVFVLPN